MTFPPIHFGLETEIGIHVDGPDTRDLVADSIALVRSGKEPGVWMRWDYACEDPHLDMRGFRVPALRQDTDEAGYEADDAARELSYVEIKSDLVLGNGARFYNDHAHPEYCTPECASVRDLVLHDRAGERILMACALELSRREGFTVRLYKNNTDYFGHSYGCHENYLIPRSIPWDELVSGIMGFLVTRQVFAGAGKFALEAEDQFLGPGFQLSQRSDFFSELQSVDTMQRRPIINTRDEPHADAARFRRFHVIVGDANLSAFATRLKVGVTALVLEAIGRAPRWDYPQPLDPLRALTEISRDRQSRWELKLTGDRPSTALAVQRRYLEAVREYCDLGSKEQADLVRDWEEVLNDLETDPRRCADRLDWVAKRELIRQFQETHDLRENDPWLRSLDLEYHRLDLHESLYYGLEQSGAMRWVPSEEEVRRAVTHPPFTRAAVRGLCVQRFAPAVMAAQWDHVTLQGSGDSFRISLLDLFGPEAIQRHTRIIAQAKSVEDLRSLT
jgi:Pup amidohydrolase